MDGERFTSRLIESKLLNEDTKILKFSVPENFEFKAGQYVTMAFYNEGKRILRSYSIFSSPHEKGFISICFKKVKEGFASGVLFDMKIDEKIEMKGPLGSFVLRNQKNELMFISAGTGFAPFRSMILNLLKNNFQNKIILLRGYRTEFGLCCENELANLKLIHKNFEYHNILSRPINKDYPFIGHVQDFLEKIVPKDFKGDFYICGLKEMVEGVKEKLLKMGISRDQIFFERYD